MAEQGPVCIEWRLLSPCLEVPLEKFFRVLRESGVERFFHPHPFTRAEAQRRANYHGKDLYYVLIESGEILGYGMLRGWDEGYDIPSLGIAVHPEHQGEGLGRLIMVLLHAAARRRCAHCVRLKVHPENTPARSLYEDMGYQFGEADRDVLVGVLDLGGASEGVAKD